MPLHKPAIGSAEELRLITRLTTGSNALVVWAESPFPGVADIVAAARALSG